MEKINFKDLPSTETPIDSTNLNLIQTYVETEINSVKTNLESQINSIASKLFPVGSIYTSVNNTNPSSFLGGTWKLFGEGMTLVGVDTSQAEFNTVLKTGGSKTQVLTEAQLPHISGQIGVHGGADGSNLWNPGGVFSSSSIISGKYKTLNQATGASSIGVIDFRCGNNEAHNNLQPYITVYFWRRVS